MPSRLRPHRRETVAGSPPGEHRLGGTADATARVIAFGSEGVDERTVQTIEELADLRARHSVIWVDVIGTWNTV